MKKDDLKDLISEQDGLKTYEFLVNHLNGLDDSQLKDVISSLEKADRTGQYLASGVRYLNAIDSDKYAEHISHMTSMIIDRDREHKYISDLIQNLYGADYYDRVDELAADNNFRRMYKRLYPDGAL